MVTEPLRFPNLVTGFERNPPHAARTALYSRYTPFEWTQSNINYYNESDTNRNYSERLRNDAVRVIRYIFSNKLNKCKITLTIIKYYNLAEYYDFLSL